jgi:hypothetical protein
MIPRYLRKSMAFALFLLATLSSSWSCEATIARPDARAAFGIKNNNNNDNAKPIASVDQVHAVRGGNIPLKPWGFLHDIQEDLFFWTQSSTHDIHVQSEHRCSRQDVVHECVLNYGSTMLGRF